MLRTKSNVVVFGTNEQITPKLIVWPEFGLVRDFMPVQIICKVHNVSIKMKKKDNKQCLLDTPRTVMVNKETTIERILCMQSIRLFQQKLWYKPISPHMH